MGNSQLRHLGVFHWPVIRYNWISFRLQGRINEYTEITVSSCSRRFPWSIFRQPLTLFDSKNEEKWVNQSLARFRAQWHLGNHPDTLLQLLASTPFPTIVCCYGSPELIGIAPPKCNILSLDPPVSDKFLVIHLTGLSALCGIGRLRVIIFLEVGDDWTRGSMWLSALASGRISNAKQINDPSRRRG